MVQIFIYLYSSKCSAQRGMEGIDQHILIENRCRVKLHILSPEICKQNLCVKSWKA